MKKKVSNDVVKQFIKSTAEKINSEYDFALLVAQNNVMRAEKELADSFSDTQKELYNHLLVARQEYNDVWVSRYKK
jgi:hypothetical protein